MAEDEQDALEKLVAAAPGIGTGGGAQSNAGIGGGTPVPQGSLKLSSPNFLSKKARGSLYAWLLVLGALSVAAGVYLVWLTHADATSNWVTPTVTVIVVGLVCFLLAYVTVGGFGSVSVSIGSGDEKADTQAAGLSVDPVTPADGTLDVDPGITVTATFSAAVNKATVTKDAFTLKKKAGGTAIGATVTYDLDHKIASLKPTSALESKTEYEASVGTGVKDAAGTALAKAKAWTFTTK